ncbi:telomere repeats-binding bouquet formation protein 1 isoform X4 [Cygnus olor]|uniref:telomere repeats-binding bouquet formation protein 1 isoform X4 n=1 Tax=Cygnus olor TaxID=8869 RepID=UPI001ADE9142|nr:telomere repeats-binding bouquet formation protein 1 isoform X4 [Cygnus olor]
MNPCPSSPLPDSPPALQPAEERFCGFSSRLFVLIPYPFCSLHFLCSGSSGALVMTAASESNSDMKTDLNLLLECLKYQMDCPLSQKEALITIYSICQQNIYCQQSLCTSALFEDLILFLINKDSGVNLKRTSVYVILVLVSNNKYGQTYVRETGCIGLLLQLFRTTLSTSEMNLSDENTYQCYQLWSSVCSTLCACVNNPQNEDNQSICCAVFPYAKEWLESCTEPEIVRPICSFVGLTVANNSTVQKYFVSVGGLDTLAKVLIKLMHDSCMSHSSTKLAVVVTKTLDACIANDSAMGGALAKYHTVSELLNLLSNDTLDTGEKISIILTIGHCTEVCEENQYELLKNNGLPLMIQVLTESQDEELNKAATFVLQNCKQMTEQLSLKINESSLNEKNADELEADVQIRERSLQDYWKKAKEILHRIKLIEKEHDEERMQGRVFVDRPSENSVEAPKYPKVNPSGPETYIERTHKEIRYPRLTSNLDGPVLALAVNSPLKNETVNAMNPVNTSTRKSEQNDIPRPVYEEQTDSVLQSHRKSSEKEGCEKRQSVLQVQKGSFKQPAKTVRNMKQACTSDHHSFSSEITKEEKSTLTTTASLKMTDLRCLGCTTAGLSFNSKTFSKMLRSCPYLCYHHKVILEAEERYKKELKKLPVSNNSRYAAYEKILLTPIKKGKSHTETSTYKSKKDNFQSILLTPIRKNKSDTSHRDEHDKNTQLPEEYNLLPTYEKSFQKNQDANLKRQCVKEKHSQECQQLKENCIYSLDEDENNERGSLDINMRTLNKKRRIRKDFTDEEINYLLTGVKEMGHHWNLILWSYPFQKGRTNVDLSSKYYKLQRQEKSKSHQ